MSDLRPTGTSIILDGVERHFLFTLNAIDEIQSHYDTAMLDVLSKLYDEIEQFQILRYFTKVLLDDEAERVKWKDPDADIKTYSEKEIGWIISRDNSDEVKTAILAAYHISLPKPEDEDPNQTSGRQSS